MTTRILKSLFVYVYAEEIL